MAKIDSLRLSARRRQVGAARAGATLLLALLLAIEAAGCGGSALDPEYVRAANAGLAGTSNATGGSGIGSGGSSVPGLGSDGTPTVPGAGTSAAVPGSGQVNTSDASGAGDGKGAVADVKTASCAGFKNQTGITDQTITIGNSSDISGPVPGLFAAAQQATKAYVAYFNATSSICGRKLVLTNLDSRTDAGADQQSYTKLCDSVFAAVGSMSAFDSGGAQAAESCGLPDIRTASVTATRNGCGNCFGAQATGPHEFSNAVADFFVKNYYPASQKAAYLYLSAGAAAENAATQINVDKQRGMKFVYTSAIDVADFNYGPYVQQMKSKGVEWVTFAGAYQQSVRLAQAMRAAEFHPEVRLSDPSVYDQNFLKTGGSAVEGASIFINFTPLEESQPELNLYKQWLQQVAPGAQPSFFGEFAWSAAKLFVQESIALGGKLTRVSLVAKIKGVHAWTGGGMHGPMDVGGKHAPSCIRFMQVKGGKFVPLASTKYTCHGSSVAR